MGHTNDLGCILPLLLRLLANIRRDHNALRYTGYNPKVHLSMVDIAFNKRTSPSVLKVSIKQSKTDPHRQGVSLFLGKTDSDICPVTAMISYLEKRTVAAGPLFRFVDGQLLTRTRFVEVVRSGMKEAGIKEWNYCSHNFCIGAATTAAKGEIEDTIIKTLGQ